MTTSGTNNLDYASTISSVEKNIVVPGNSAKSLLCLKLKETLAEGIKGSRMPKNGPKYLNEIDIKLICDWIDQGAKNN